MQGDFHQARVSVRSIRTPSRRIGSSVASIVSETRFLSADRALFAQQLLINWPERYLHQPT